MYTHPLLFFVFLCPSLACSVISWKDHLRVERRDGGLLLGTEALHFVFRRDGGVGWVKKPTIASKQDREGFYWA